MAQAAMEVVAVTDRQERTFRRFVGLLALVVPVGMALFFALLTLRFQYPGILDQTPEQVLERLGRTKGIEIPGYWLGVMLCAVLLVALVYGLDRVLRDDARAGGSRLAYLSLVTPFGVLAAFCMVLDVSQWVWVYPGLGEQFSDPSTTAAAREDVVAAWNGFHQFVGKGIGIYLATLFTALWAFGVGWVMLAARRFPLLLAWLGMAAGGLHLASIVPGAGWYQIVGQIAFLPWAAWLVGSGCVLFCRSD